MRITFLTQWFDPEPAAIRGLPLATYLASHGHDVEVVTGFPNYPGGAIYPGYRMRFVQREVVDGVRITRVPLYPSHDMSALGRLGNYGSFAVTAATIGLAAARPADVLYVYHPPATIGLPARLWKGLRSTPFVYHIADMWPESVTESGMIRSPRAQHLVHRGLSWWCDGIYRAAEKISVLSPGFKRLLVERGVPSDKVEVIYNWADESVFFPTGRDDELAKTLGLDSGITVMFTGNLGHFQCLDIAIRAAARLSDRPGFRLVFVGTGHAEGALKELAVSLRAPNVVFLPRRDQREMNAIVNLADAMLVSLQDLPFFSTTIPSKTQVALAAGRPLVMAARGDAAQLVVDAEAGIVAQPADEAALADAFDRLYRMCAEERAAMGTRGRDYYLRELSLAEGGARTERLLLSAAAAPRPVGARRG